MVAVKFTGSKNTSGGNALLYMSKLQQKNKFQLDMQRNSIQTMNSCVILIPRKKARGDFSGES